MLQPGAPPSSGSNGYLLEIQGLTKAFKGLLAVDRYHLRLPAGEILGIIGPNGAGKTTVFNMLTGYVKPTRGRIHFAGRDVTGRPPDFIAALGVGRTFQNIRLFHTMTVLENVKSARQLRDRDNLFTTVFSLPSFQARERRLDEACREQLDLFNLLDRADVPATSLSYGDQRRLEMVRALALQPKLLLLDEPTAGMTSQESLELVELILRIHERYKLTIIVVEHNMPVVMQLSDRIQALDYGAVIGEGTPDEIRANPQVIEAYLGRSHS